MVRAWKLTYPDQPAPEDRETICAKMKDDKTLYDMLIRKVKSRTQAAAEHKARKDEERTKKDEEKARKEQEKEKKAKERAEKRREKEAKESQQGPPSARRGEKPPTLDTPDITPFPPEIVERAKTEVDPSTPQFWTHLYSRYADQMVPRYTYMDTIKDPASDVTPTMEFPWSAMQLGMPRNEAVAKFKNDAEYRRQMAQIVPAYNFVLMDSLFERTELLESVARHTYTPYIPWPPRYLHHFLTALTDVKDLDPNDETAIRIALIRAWRDAPLLQKYVANLTPVSMDRWVWNRIAPFSTLLTTYATWDIEGKEFENDRLQNLWANDILLRTYELQRSSHGRGKTSYFDLLTDIVTNSKEFKLFQTNAGVFLLKSPEEVAQLKLQDMPFYEYRSPPPLKWNKTSIVQQATNLLKKAEADQRSSPGLREAVLDDMDGEQNVPSKTKELRQLIRGFFMKIQVFCSSIEMFLTTLYLKNEGFRTHTALFAANLETLRLIYSESLGRKYNPSTKISKNTVQQWAQENRPPEAIKGFEQDIRTSVYQTVPPILADSAKRFQQFVDETWHQYRLPPVSDQPAQSTCGEKHTSQFIQPDNAQLFMNAEFNPGSFENGKIIVHSVGSGKTCLSIRIASDFARAGFRIVWVTKHALRNQVLKNHVSEICNLLIREEYDRIHFLEGKPQADTWLRTKIPKQTNFQDVLNTLRGLGMDWTNMSYRQFSNALEPEPRNETGRAWRKQAGMAGSTDPLRKTLVIVDEAHKMFTGELDRTELPNVPVIHGALQHSYNTSDDQRCRLLLLTATPTTDSMLPLITMLNMLHYRDVFPYNMATIDPHITTDEGLLEHLQTVKRQNQETELKVACDMFPKGLRFCGRGQVQPVEDEDDPKDAHQYFDAKTIIGANTFKPNELTNNLQEFWTRAFGLISYYDISADYSKFPRTEYARIIMPSATMLQERLMASELVSSKKDLAAQSKKVRQIAAWAAFQSVDKPSRQPDALDKIIMAENAQNTYFEPTLEDLELRKQDVMAAIQQEEASQPDPDDVATLQFYQKGLREAQEKQEAKIREMARLEEDDEGRMGSTKTKTRAQKEGQITKDINKLRQHMANLETEISRLETAIQFHNTTKSVRIQYHQKRLVRIDKQIEKLRKRSRRSQRHNTHAIQDFLQRVDEHPELVEEPDEEEPEEPKRRGGGRKKRKEEDEDEEEEDEEVENVEEIKAEEQVEEKIKGEYYMKKSWKVLKRALPNEQPNVPKKHYFDQPDTFDAEQFRQDMPLYSPKTVKLIEMMMAVDQDDLRNNPESHESHRLRKHLIFCEDIHDIRAAAGALTAHGWTMGMKRAWVEWEKEFFSTETNKKVGRTLTSKAKQLTWLPSAENGEDYKRFLVLTRSKLGGVSGATLNDYAIQQIGAMGPDATYNHLDNAMGKQYRAILIDRNFVEGIDLPSTYAHLFDAVLSKSSRTQIVGRISRFCGHSPLPFVANFGWPQKVFRYDLKFHTVGLHMSDSQWEKFTEKVMHPEGQYAKIVPERYREAFLEKIEKNLFSPTELQILLDGNMEVQRIRKKTLDVYEALMEKVSIGALLYAPAMRNLAMARHELDDLLLEEDETANEYRREIFAQDQKRQAVKVSYQLRSRENTMMQWQIHDSMLISMLQYHVKQAIRNTPRELVGQWLEEEKVHRFFERYVKKDMQDASLVTTSEEHAQQVLAGMFKERVHELQGRQQERQRKLSKKQAKTTSIEQRKHQKLVAHQINLAKGKAKRLKTANKEEIWDKVKAALPQTSRDDFDRVYAKLLERKPVGSKREKSSSRKSTSRRIKTTMGALLATKKAYSMDKRKLEKSQELQENLVSATLTAHPGFTREQVQGALKEWLEKND